MQAEKSQQVDLLQATSGLVLDLEQAKSLITAVQLQGDDDDGLTQIIFGLGAMHRLLKRGCGNLEPQSLCRSANGRLVLVCRTTRPSLCESTALNDVAGRFFLNLGEQAREIDDLISLGVIAAEILVPPKKRPALTADHGAYRKGLADQIPRAALRRADRFRNRLIKLLLLCEKDPQLTTAQFLRNHIPLIDLASGTSFKAANWSDVARYFRKSSLSAMALVAFCFVSLWVFWSREQSARKWIQRDLDSSSAEVAALKKKISDLETSIANQFPPKAHEPQGPTTQVERLIADPRYQVFMNDRNLKDNTEFQSLLLQKTLSKLQVDFSDAFLNDLIAAAQVWWKIVDTQASENEASKLIAGQTNPRVSQILNVWYGEAATSELRTLTLKDSSVPSNYRAYEFRLSFFDIERDMYIYTEPYETLFVQEGSSLMRKSGKTITFPMRWKASQSISFLLEDWSPLLYWYNVVRQKAGGALALPFLAKRNWEQDGFSMSFDISPLPGPPVESAKLVPGRIEFLDGRKDKLDGSGSPIFLSDELK